MNLTAYEALVLRTTAMSGLGFDKVMVRRFRFLLSGFFGIVILSNAAGEEAPLALRLVTFNIRFANEKDEENYWPHRRDLFMETVREMAPDVMGVQEALSDQLKDLDSAFTQWKRVGVGRDDGLEAGEFSAVYFNSDRFELLDGGTFWLSDTPDVAGSNTWEAACNRVCSWVHLKDRKTDRKVAVYNAHLDHQKVEAREKAMPLIAARALAKDDGETPIVVMGDFNAGPMSPPVRFWLGDVVTIDGKETKSPLVLMNPLTADPEGKQATFHGFKGGEAGVPIDYVLLSGKPHIERAVVVRTQRDGRYPSDHYPVLCELVYRPGDPVQ